MQPRNIHFAFRISVFLKGIHAVLELILGSSLLLVSTDTLIKITSALTADEIVEDPHDSIAQFFYHSLSNFSVADHTFAAYYLLSHGVVKIFLVLALLMNKLWAYPLSLLVLGLFIAYQLYRFTFTHSILLILLSIFDVFVMYLIYREYKLLKHHKEQQEALSL